MLISLTEYARLNGRNPATARQMALRGGFRTARKVGRDWMIDSEEPYPDKRRKNAMQMSVYEVGKQYGFAAGHEEGCYFDLADAGGTIAVYMDRPTEQEIKAMRPDQPIKMAMVPFKHLTMILLKFGDQSWMDAPYTVHLSRQLTQLPDVADGDGILIVIHLFDTSDGHLVSMRQISLSTDLSRAVIKVAREQRATPFDELAYADELRSVYSKYQTRDLVKMASRIYNVFK